MTAKCALAMALLEGRVLNVKNCFETIGLTNIAREIPRMIEEPFGITVSRTHMTGKSRYGQSVSYTNYRLNTTKMNEPGREKMLLYCREQVGAREAPKTSQQAKEFKQQELFLGSL